MTDVNYAEAKYSIVKKDGALAWAEAAKVLQGLPIDFPFYDPLVGRHRRRFQGSFQIEFGRCICCRAGKGEKS